MRGSEFPDDGSLQAKGYQRYHTCIEDLLGSQPWSLWPVTQVMRAFLKYVYSQKLPHLILTGADLSLPEELQGVAD